MRPTIPLVFLMTACSSGRLVDDGGSWARPDVHDIEQLARTDNLGYGVAPKLYGAGAWLGMGDRACLIEPVEGTVSTDLQLTGEGVGIVDVGHEGTLYRTNELGIRLLLPGQYHLEIPAVGDLVAGALASDHVLVAGATADGCMLTWSALTGESSAHEVVAEHCESDADLDGGALGGFAAAGGDVLRIGIAGPEPFADGDRVSVDDHAGLVFVGDRGGDTIRALDGAGVHQFDVPLPGGLIDLAARGGTLVALLDTEQLVRFDAHDGKPVDERPYFGPMGMERVELSRSGRGLMTTNDRWIQFYRIH